MTVEAILLVFAATFCLTWLILFGLACAVAMRNSRRDSELTMENFQKVMRDLDGR